MLLTLQHPQHVVNFTTSSWPQKCATHVVNIYIYIPFHWQTICEQVQNYLSCEPGSFFVNIFSSWQCKFQNKARETSSTLYGGFWDIPCPTTENVDKKWTWLTTKIILYLFTYSLSVEGYIYIYIYNMCCKLYNMLI